MTLKKRITFLTQKYGPESLPLNRSMNDFTSKPRACELEMFSWGLSAHYSIYCTI